MYSPPWSTLGTATPPPQMPVYSSMPTALRFIECTTEARHLEALLLLGNDCNDVFLRLVAASIPGQEEVPNVSRSTNVKIQYNTVAEKGPAFAAPSLARPTAPVPLFSSSSPIDKKFAHPLRLEATAPWHRLGHHYYRTESQIVHLGKTSMRLQYRFFTVPRSQIKRDFNDRTQDVQYSQLAPKDEPERQFATSIASLAFISWSEPNEQGHRTINLAPCPLQDQSWIRDPKTEFFRSEGVRRRPEGSARPGHAFKIDLPLRLSDIDQLGHVTNSRYALLLHDVLSHGLEMGYYANGSGPLKTPSTLPVYSGKANAASSDIAMVNIPVGSQYYSNAEIEELYIGFENELKVEDTIVVWSWVEREKVPCKEGGLDRPLDVVMFEFCKVDAQGKEKKVISLCRAVIRERLERLPVQELQKAGYNNFDAKL